MTAMGRFERDLPAGLEALAAPSTPDYLADILGQTAATSQRPAWTFPERWFPMADIASRPAFAPRMPLRLIAVALVILALLVSAALFVGSRQTKLPPPFGPAGNGLVAYSKDGDIFVADPLTGESRAIVTGPEQDGYPLFSPNGQLLAFDRETDRVGLLHIGVVASDGSNVRVVTPEPISGETKLAWAPDSSALYMTTFEGELRRVDVERVGPPQVIAHDVAPDFPSAHPVDGRLLYRPRGSQQGLWVMEADGTGKRQLIAPDPSSPTTLDFLDPRWSPDGTRISFTRSPVGLSDQRRIYVADADGTNVHPLTDAAGIWTEVDLQWSPDGTRIAFNRWEQDPATSEWQVRAIGVAPASGGAAADLGPVPVPEGALFDFAPDGQSIYWLPGPVGDDPAYDDTKVLAIESADGSTTELAWPTGMVPTWQRAALDH